VASLSEDDPVLMKVGDFGLTQEVVGDGVTGFLDSWMWLPPETWTDRPYSLSADIWSMLL
jgi:hypothetical protein